MTLVLSNSACAPAFLLLWVIFDETRDQFNLDLTELTRKNVLAEAERLGFNVSMFALLPR